MLHIKETRLHAVTKNTHRELKVCFLIHPDEYTTEIEDVFYTLKNEAVPLSIKIEKSDYETPQEKPSKATLLDHLHNAMVMYANATDTSIDTVKAELYKKHGIKSRSALDEETIQEEIKSYQAGIEEYHNKPF